MVDDSQLESRLLGAWYRACSDKSKQELKLWPAGLFWWCARVIGINKAFDDVLNIKMNQINMFFGTKFENFIWKYLFLSKLNF